MAMPRDSRSKSGHTTHVRRRRRDLLWGGTWRLVHRRISGTDRHGMRRSMRRLTFDDVQRGKGRALVSGWVYDARQSTREKFISRWRDVCYFGVRRQMLMAHDGKWTAGHATKGIVASFENTWGRYWDIDALRRSRRGRSRHRP
jgi:hypothetical protein